MSKYSEMKYKQLGFDNAFQECYEFGYFCNLKRGNLNSIPISPLLTRSPLKIFFVLPESENFLEKFYQLNFSSIHKNPFLQIPYRITYKVKKVTSENSLLLSNFMGVTFMCKFCNSNRSEFFNGVSSRTGYPFKDYPVPCHSHKSISKNCREAMRKVYMNWTGDGKKIFYWLHNKGNFISPNVRTSKLLQQARSVLEVISAVENIGNIIISILSEKTPNNGKTWFPVSFPPGISLIPGINNTFGLLRTEFESYNFITCYRKQVQIGPDVYLKPFQLSVWLALFSSIFFTFVVFNFNRMSLSGSRAILFTIISLLFNTIVSNSQLQNVKRYRRLILVWLFGAMILNTAYRGQNFAKVVARNEGQKLNLFSDLAATDFKLYTLSSCYNKEIRLTCSFFGMKLAGWAVDKIGSINYHTKFEVFHRNIFNPPEYNFTFLEKYIGENRRDKMLARLMSRITPSQVYSADIKTSYWKLGKLIGKCGKQAFVALQNEIRHVLKGFNHNCSYKSSKFYSGKDSLFKDVGIWYVQENGGSYLRRRMRYLEYSGIYEFWKKWVEPENSGGGICNDERGKKLSLNSGIIVICFVYLFGCFVASGTLLMEWFTKSPKVS
ncbi:unnamed protein product [Orchesella dallaii]|uniref:Uncharacterized protein n=1 Tax=Orchesella dallaii TaxID=48710 RepID=A0ABP1RIR7_9HEXA